MASSEGSTSKSEPMASTRSKSFVQLIGHMEEKITGMQLPTTRQVLSVFFHKHKREKLTVRESSRSTVREVLEMWEMARIPTTIERNAIEKLEMLFQRWKKLMKNAKRQSDTQMSNMSAFEKDLEKLFDIAHADALSLIKIEEDKAFLLDQRSTTRSGYMAGVDVVLAKKEGRTLKRKLAEKKRAEREGCRKLAEMTPSSLQDSDDNPEEHGLNNDKDYICENLKTKAPKKSKKNPFVSPKLATALDRTNISDRQAMFVLAAAAPEGSLDSVTLSRSSIRRARISNRSQTAAEIKDKFESEGISISVHWDGKMLPDLTGQETVDRNAIIVTGNGIEKLLGVPKTQDGTGKSISDAVFITLKEWKMDDRICCMCFDTTASNTGRISGACHRLEMKLGRDLLYLACRHHICEIVLSDVFKACMCPSSGPDVAIFQRFKKQWACIDQDKYHSAVQDEELSEVVKSRKDDVVQYIAMMLQSESSQPRDDYRELMELTLIFLGEVPPRGIHFMAPGAVHRARWMAKAIYSIKIWLFRKQFKLTVKESQALRYLSLFICLVYCKAWIACPLPSAAPANDLNFLAKIIEFQDIHLPISQAAKKAFTRHLWYLSQELVAFAFFDEATDVSTKRKMVASLGKPGLPHSETRAEEPKKGSTLPDFVTESTLRFFSILKLDSDFLKIDPGQWDTCSQYVSAKQLVKSLKVTNDTAERGIKLIQDFNDTITKDEQQKQYLLQVVASHRAMFPVPNKGQLK